MQHQEIGKSEPKLLARALDVAHRHARELLETTVQLRSLADEQSPALHAEAAAELMSKLDKLLPEASESISTILPYVADYFTGHIEDGGMSAVTAHWLARELAALTHHQVMATIYPGYANHHYPPLQFFELLPSLVPAHVRENWSAVRAALRELKPIQD